MSEALAAIFVSIWETVGKDFFERQWEKQRWRKAAKQLEERLEEDYGRLRILGQRESQPLDALFTTVKVLPEEKHRHFFNADHLPDLIRDRRAHLPASAPQRGVDFLRASQQDLFIIGRPGAGKTTFMKYLTLQAARGSLYRGDDEQRVPILIQLRDHVDSGRATLLESFVNEFRVCGFPDATHPVEALLQQGKGLILLDGLDEVNLEGERRSKLISEIKDLRRRYRRCRFVLTTRLHAADYTFDDMAYLVIADFSDEQIETFIDNWFGEDGQKAAQCWEELRQPHHEGLLEIARQPLLLTLICYTYKRTLRFPEQRGWLYEDAISALLTDWDSERNVRRGLVESAVPNVEAYRRLTHHHKLELFAEIAYRGFVDSTYLWEQRELEQQLAAEMAEVVGTVGELDGRVLLQTINAQHGIFTERAVRQFSFSHLTFQEFFTAKYIADNTRHGTLETLVQHAADTRWAEVFHLTTTLLSKRDKRDFFDELLLALQLQVAERPNAVKWLTQIASTAAHSKSNYRSAAIRSFLTFILFLDSAPVFAHIFFLFFDLDLALARDLDLARGLNHILEPYLDLSHIYTLATTLNLRLARDLKLDTLVTALEMLAVPVPDAPRREWQTFHRDLQQLIETHQPLDNLRALEAEFEQLGEALRKPRLDDADIEALVAFANGSSRLHDCLQVSYLPPAERQTIEDQLLLPPS